MRILYISGQNKNPLLKSLSKKVSVIKYPRNQNNILKVLTKIPKPDLIFLQEEQPLNIPLNLEKIKIPKAVYLVDMHLHFNTWHKYFAKLFDYIFVAQKQYVKEFRKIGVKNIYWLPLYSDPESDKNMKLKRTFDIGFVGTINKIQNHKRSFLLWLLKKKFTVKIGEKKYGKKRGEIYNQCKIAINLSIASDLNFRTFEAIASGAMLLVDKQDSLLSLFRNKKHLVIYNNFFQAIKMTNYYLKNNMERIRIAKAGQKEVLKKHSSDNRAKTIIQIIKNHDYKRTKKINGSKISYILGRTYLFNYKFNKAAYYFQKANNDKNLNIITKIELLFYLLMIKFSPKLIIRTLMILTRRIIIIFNKFK